MKQVFSAGAEAIDDAAGPIFEHRGATAVSTLFENKKVQRRVGGNNAPIAIWLSNRRPQGA